MKTVLHVLLVLAVVLSSSANACDSPAFLKLQQLVGEWQVTRNGQSAGTLSVRTGAGGCALIEEWIAANGTRASALHWPEEVAADDETTKTVLHQVHVDNTGWVVNAEGGIENGVLVYEGKTALQGEDVVLRATLHGLGTDTIVHIGDVSKDGGATWQRTSTLRYQRKP